jgi:hypothetical protein
MFPEIEIVTTPKHHSMYGGGGGGGGKDMDECLNMCLTLVGDYLWGAHFVGQHSLPRRKPTSPTQ